MKDEYVENVGTTAPIGDHGGIERQLRNRLRLAQQIVSEKTGSRAPAVVVAVFEQLCFRYDEVSSAFTH